LPLEHAAAKNTRTSVAERKFLILI
jgi:hypothetical protein